MIGTGTVSCAVVLGTGTVSCAIVIGTGTVSCAVVISTVGWIRLNSFKSVKVFRTKRHQCK